MGKSRIFNASPSKQLRDGSGVILRSEDPQSSFQRTGKGTESISDPQPGRDISPGSLEASNERLTPVFLTPQSLATFPGASLAINIIWNISAAVYQPLGNATWVPLIAACLIGIVIYQQSYTEPMNGKQKFSAILVTTINTLWLLSIALDIDIISSPKA